MGLNAPMRRLGGHTDTRRTGTSTAKADDERLLLPRLHGVHAIPITDPGDGIAGWKSTKDCQAGQGRSRSSMASKATQLHSVSAAGAFQQRPKGGHHGRRVTGHAEIGPVEVIVGPRRIPLRVEIETEIGNLVAGVGISGIKRNGGDLGPIGQHHDGSV